MRNQQNAVVLVATFGLFMHAATAVVTAQPLPPQAPGYLGLIVEASGRGPGLQIMELTPGGPAEKAGLQVDDRVMMIDNVAINSASDISRAMSGKTVGMDVLVRYVRSGAEGAANVTLGARPSQIPALRPPQGPSGQPKLIPPALPQGQPKLIPPALPKDVTDDGILLGVRTTMPQLRDLLRIKAPGQFTRGALVREVFANSPAALVGLQVDDLIYGVDGRDVTSPAQLIRRIKQAGPGKTVVISYFSNGQNEKVSIPLASSPSQPPADPPVAPLPPAATYEKTLEARLEQMERRMTALEQRIIDMQRTIDELRQRP